MTRLTLIAVALLVLAGAGCRGSAHPAAGRVFAVKGAVEVVHAGAKTTLSPKQVAPLSPGDGVRVGEQAEALVECAGHVSYLRERSELVFRAPPPESPGGPPMRVELLRGVATFLVPRAEKPRDYRFEAVTGTVIAAVKGTEFTLEVTDDETRLSVFKGVVELLSARERRALAMVGPGEEIAVKTGEATSATPTPVTPQQKKRRASEHTAISILLDALGTGINIGVY
ncbi:MAG: FecR domain-containing protein [Candidatus Wallbacteria bacterium]|nr:FecR domain-containing protein [Candidatus Wallbacteria bacterium]